MQHETEFVYWEAGTSECDPTYKYDFYSLISAAVWIGLSGGTPALIDIYNILLQEEEVMAHGRSSLTFQGLR